MKGATSHGTASVSKTFGTLAIGATALRNRSIRIADLPVFKVLGMSEGPAMILGIDTFAGTRFIVDYPSRRLSILRSAGRLTDAPTPRTQAPSMPASPMTQ